MTPNDKWPPESPYHQQFRLDVTQLHNPGYDQQALCVCGHPYAAHFATDEGMLAVGCRACNARCRAFTPATPPTFPTGTPPVYFTLAFSRDGLTITPGGPYLEPAQAAKAANHALLAGAGAVQILEASATGVRFDAHLTVPDATDEEPPYLLTVVTEVHRQYNPNYGDDRMCVCGHSYYRHFDTYEGMEAVGCKYCGSDCDGFVEAPTA